MRMPTALLVAVAVVGTVLFVVVADQGSHSVSDTLYHAVVPVALVWIVAGIAFAWSRAAGRR